MADDLHGENTTRPSFVAAAPLNLSSIPIAWLMSTNSNVSFCGSKNPDAVRVSRTENNASVTHRRGGVELVNTWRSGWTHL
jgi:hypothetical protein